MMTSTDPISNPRDDSELLLQASGLQAELPFGGAQDVFEDPYAENELITRHERTERAIRRAREQF